MRKVICIFIVILGIGVIGLGIALQLNDHHVNKSYDLDPREVNNNVIALQELNKFNQETVCDDFSSISTFINTNDYKKISFTYPNCLHEYELSRWSKKLKTDDDRVNVSITKKNQSLDDYIAELKTKLDADKNSDYYQNLEYTELKKLKNINGLDMSYIESNYQTKVINDTTNYDCWYVVGKIDNDTVIIYDISSTNSSLSVKAIEELIKNLKIEDEKAVFKNTEIENDYQVGYIYQNILNSYEHGYRVKLKIPSEYEEVDSYSSDFDQSTFSYEKNSKKVNINIKIDNDISNTNIYKDAQKMHDISISNYSDKDKYRNVDDTKLIKNIIADKEIYYFIYKYDLYDDNSKVSTNYYSYIYYQIANNMYLKIYINNNDERIDESFISKILDFTVEEY